MSQHPELGIANLEVLTLPEMTLIPLRTSTYTLVGGKAEIHMLNLSTKELFVYEIDADVTKKRNETRERTIFASHR